MRLVAGAAFGAVVGIEREVDGHEAGLRTHMLLALGSALFGTLSVGAFGSFIDGSNAHVSFDPSRIASYVVAGIGFLGAGSILKRDDRVHTPVASPDEHVERTSASDGAQSRTSA